MTNEKVAVVGMRLIIAVATANGPIYLLQSHPLDLRYHCQCLSSILTLENHRLAIIKMV